MRKLAKLHASATITTINRSGEMLVWVSQWPRHTFPFAFPFAIFVAAVCWVLWAIAQPAAWYLDHS